MKRVDGFAAFRLPSSFSLHYAPTLTLVWARRWSIVALACLVAASILWISSFSRMDPEKLDDFGLFSILPWTIWTALALLTLGFVISLQANLARSVLPALYLAGLVVILHATPAIEYQTLRYSWAWKHIGIVDYIQRHGSLDPVAPYLAAYHNWPGFFAVSALLSNTLGLHSLEIAHLVRFAPTLLNLLYFCVLTTILRRFTSDRRLIWGAAWIFVAGNWVGQDYFSPQGVTFLLYLAVVSLCLGPLCQVVESNYPGRESTKLQAVLIYLQRRTPQCPQYNRILRIVAALVVLLLVLAIVASHQLTPLVLISAMAGLSLIGRLHLGYVAFAIVAETLWLLYFAGAFVAANLPDELATFGQAIHHFSRNFVDLSKVSNGQFWVSLASRGLTAAIGIAAIAGGLRRLAFGHVDGAAIILVLAPLPLLAATSYGGEVVFRVYLFALPFLGFFAASLFIPAEEVNWSLITRTCFMGFALFLTIGFILANNGKDRQYRFAADEVAAADWVYKNAPLGTLLIEGARNYPSQFFNYENFTYVPIAEESWEYRLTILREPATILAQWLDDPKWRAGFVIITRSQKAYVDAEGIMPVGSLDQIEQDLLASPKFKVVFASANARVFTLSLPARASDQHRSLE